MNIHYKIVEVWPDDHLIVARYWTDVITEEYLNSYPDNPDRKEDGSPLRCRSDVSITLPIPTPTGDDLENIILKNAPTIWLTTLEAAIDPNIDTTMRHILEMKDKTFTKTIVNEDESSAVLTDDEIRKLIEKFSTDKNG